MKYARKTVPNNVSPLKRGTGWGSFEDAISSDFPINQDVKICSSDDKLLINGKGAYWDAKKCHGVGSSTPLIIQN